MAISQLPSSPSGEITHGQARVKINEIASVVNAGLADSVVILKTAADFNRTWSSTIAYFIDGDIDLTGSGFNCEIPAGGVTIKGFGYKTSRVSCSDDDYDLFTAPLGGCGGFILDGFAIEITGSNSRVYGALTASSSFEAIELYGINYENCTSRGEIIGFRQVFASGIGLIGGTPEITLSGAMNGYKIVNSNALGLSDMTALYKAGTGLVFSDRFSTNMKVNLPAIGAFADFSESNFADDLLFEINDATFRRQGVEDATSTTIIPNITEKSVKSKWSNMTGLPDTQKYLRAKITTEIATSLPNINEYQVLAGTFTVDDESHFSMPNNGEFAHITGYDFVDITGSISLTGTKNDLLDLRIVKSDDNFATFTVVNHLQSRVNDYVGPIDTAKFDINFGTPASKIDKFRMEVERKDGSSGTSVTALLDSFIKFSKNG